MDNEAKNDLLRFEKSITTWHQQLRHEPPLLGTLLAQIERMETSNEVHNLIEALSSKSIGVLAGQYSHWVREEVNYYEDLWELTYQSTDFAVIALRPWSVTTTKISVDRGELPPRTFRHIVIPVRINGHEVWDGRTSGPFTRELDDEVSS